MNNNTIKITPVPGCRNCNGQGIVNDYVPWGDTHVPMPSTCDCVTDQIPEEYEDCEIELVPPGEADVTLINKH